MKNIRIYTALLLVLFFFLIAPILLLCSGCGDYARQSPQGPRAQLYVYTAEWCGQCQTDKPVIAAIKATGRVEIITIDADKDPQAARYAPELPYYVVLVDGRSYWQGGDIRMVYTRVIGK